MAAPPAPPLRRAATDPAINPSGAAASLAPAGLDGSPGVSKPQNVKRMMHVEWDPATGAFKVRGMFVLSAFVRIVCLSVSAARARAGAPHGCLPCS